MFALALPPESITVEIEHELDPTFEATLFVLMVTRLLPTRYPSDFAKTQTDETIAVSALR